VLYRENADLEGRLGGRGSKHSSLLDFEVTMAGLMKSTAVDVHHTHIRVQNIIIIIIIVIRF
jgi:hypothetical protein